MTNRVAGFVCKYILADHKSCVTSLAVVDKASSGSSCTYMVQCSFNTATHMAISGVNV